MDYSELKDFIKNKLEWLKSYDTEGLESAIDMKTGAASAYTSILLKIEEIEQKSIR